MPDDPAARARLPRRPDPPQRLVHGDELLVAGQLADGAAAVDLEHDEVAHDIEDVARLEEPVEQDVLGRRRASEIFSSRQNADTDVSRWAIAAWASRTWAFDSANFLPPLRSRARAAVSPARVRSRFSSRSNSASTGAKMPNTRRPAAVVVSICAPWPVNTRRPTPQADRSCTVLTSWARFRPSRIELPDDERVALSLGAQAAVESRPVVADAGGEVVVEVGRVVDARGPEGVALQVQRLGAVGLRDAGVADQHVSQTNVLGHEDAGGFPASACMPLRPAQSSPRPARPGSLLSH